MGQRNDRTRSKRRRGSTADSDRFATGIPGLDEVLFGGLLRDRLYVVGGDEGSGKTVLVSQLAFGRARMGEQVAFVSLVSESQGAFLTNLATLTYFDPQLVGTSFRVANGFEALDAGGLPGLSQFLRALILNPRARLLILDSLSTVEEVASRPYDLKRFLRELSTYASLLGCTVVALANTSTDPAPHRVVVDGWIQLSRVRTELRTARTLEVVKFRGSPTLEGRHSFEISSDGIRVWPRIESRSLVHPPWVGAPREVVSTGITGLDQMLQGGLLEGSSTALLGAPGAGKTMMGLQLLAEGARRNEPGLCLSFYEPPERLVAKANGIGLPMQRYVGSGLVQLVWQPPLEHSPDALAERLLHAIRERKVRRVFIDGIDAFRLSMLFPDRLSRFFAALINELRAMEVTCLLAQELQFFAERTQTSLLQPSAIYENILLLRYTEVGANLYRLLQILKVRDREYDASTREFRISSRGFEVATSSESARGILAGDDRSLDPSRFKSRIARRGDQRR